LEAQIVSSVVFILGAGASRQAGAPLMNDFLDVAYDLWKMGRVSDADESFKVVFQGRSALQDVHSKADLDIHNVEAVFAAFEMAKTLKKFADYSPEQIDALINAMKTVIAKTIEQTLVFPIQEHRPHPPPPYRDFGELIKYLTSEAQPKQTVSIISFNYDMAVDYAFCHHEILINYALGEQKHRDSIPVLKLHGSLNWAQCKSCGEVVPWEVSSYYSKFVRKVPVVESMALPIGSHISHFKHCEGDVEQEPVLVPPTWSKTEYHRALSSVWARAAKELGEAENIFVIGYSLPPSDAFFRHLYALGAVGEATLKRFWVFNPDNSGEVEDRFVKLLGPGAQQRFRYFPRTFDDSISILGDVFGPILRAP
jgi:NAD-dependent SIR2 family protein deacetylase